LDLKPANRHFLELRRKAADFLQSHFSWVQCDTFGSRDKRRFFQPTRLLDVSSRAFGLRLAIAEKAFSSLSFR
jgi:hypothetical protein